MSKQIDKAFFDKFQFPNLLEKFEFIPAEVIDFFMSARKSELEEILEELIAMEMQNGYDLSRFKGDEKLYFSGRSSATTEILSIIKDHMK